MIFPSNPGANMTCGFKVNTQSPEWSSSMTKVLSKIDGLSYAIDIEEGMAYVSGRVDPNSILKKLNKSIKHAELSWVTTGSNTGNGCYDNYERYKQDASYGNYERYKQDVCSTYPYWDYRRPPVAGPVGYLPPVAAPGYPPQVPYAPGYGYQPFVYDPNAYWHRNMY